MYQELTVLNHVFSMILSLGQTPESLTPEYVLVCSESTHPESVDSKAVLFSELFTLERSTSVFFPSKNADLF